MYVHARMYGVCVIHVSTETGYCKSKSMVEKHNLLAAETTKKGQEVQWSQPGLIESLPWKGFVKK